MTKAKYVVAFVGQEAGRATFVEINRITGWRVLEDGEFATFPGNAELIGLGMDTREPGAPECAGFDLEATGLLADYKGRLVVDWPKPEISWCRWANNGVFRIRHIVEESRFDRGFPEWDEVVLTWDQLSVLPPSGRAALSKWRGVYFIFDEVRRAGYVGSASGEDNLLGRWKDYAANGHGDNKLLRDSDPRDLRFSVLQLVSPNMDPADVGHVEATWKRRLHTRAFGLNMN